MKYDIILSGVGGQGVLSVAAIISIGAMSEGLEVRQSEVHGMSQRGGAVLAHLRISDRTIQGDLVAKGSAEMILSMEPLESLRYLDYLAPDGVLVTSSVPLENIPNYPDLDGILEKVGRVPGSRLVDTKALAREAGSPRTVNMVMVGAASAAMPITEDAIRGAVRTLFGRKGEEVVAMNLRAFELGRA